ncbi:MAG TPA: hypothetical protein VKG67_04185 [Gallionellaceae bacterium]|nr:hypothetical protein [Gallionellaceae bacterium]
MALKWFDASAAEKFGQSLAQFFIKKIPLTAENKKNKAIAKQLEAVDQMYLQIEQFKLNNSLNVYKKAKLGSAFKYALIAAGYKPELVDQVTKGLMLKL